MITVVASSTLEKKASPDKVQKLIFYTWRDICKHLILSLCDRGRLPSLSTLFTLLLTRGDILSVYALFLLSLPSQPTRVAGAVRMSAGEASDR